MLFLIFTYVRIAKLSLMLTYINLWLWVLSTRTSKQLAQTYLLSELNWRLVYVWLDLNIKLFHKLNFGLDRTNTDILYVFRTQICNL